jgi:hypothetical protein
LKKISAILKFLFIFPVNEYHFIVHKASFISACDHRVIAPVPVLPFSAEGFAMGHCFVSFPIAAPVSPKTRLRQGIFSVFSPGNVFDPVDWMDLTA